MPILNPGYSFGLQANIGRCHANSAPLNFFHAARGIL